MESKLAPLAQENVGLQESLVKSTGRNSQMSNDLQTAKTTVHALQRRVAELEQNEAALNDNLRRAQEMDRKRVSKLTTVERQLADSQETSKEMSKQYEQYRTECSKLTNDNMMFKDRISNIMKELEQTQKDVADIQTLRRAERNESEKQLSLAQDDLSRLADEARIRHTEYSEQLTSNTREHQEQLHR